jgi:16S rRNA (uracil1498-N3)-methyltransferase
MPRFYVNQNIQVGEEIILPQNVVQHLNVIRIKANDTISIFNGDGFSYKATLNILEKRNAIVYVENKENILEQNNINLSLALSIIANDKMDLAIRGAVELGVSCIIPIISQYSQKLTKDKIESRMEHWQKVIISSCEQSGQNNIPEIHTPIILEDFIKNNTFDNKFILSLYQHDNSFNNSKLQNLSSVSLLVGPEGGFTEDEVSLAVKHNYIAIKPWHNILRTETAVIAGISLILNNFN